MKKRQTFLVGRRTSRSTVVVVVQKERAPIRGPWTLKAVVTPGSA